MTTVSEIKAANAAAGYYFFSRDTMKFFRSRVGATVYEGRGGIYYVTSEQFVGSDGSSGPRRFTVRQFNPDCGDINTVGPFNEMSSHKANKLAGLLAEGYTLDEANARI